MGKDDGVEENNLAGNHDVTAEDGDGGIQLAVNVEEGIVLHLGEWFVWVWVIRSPLNPRPGAHGGVPAYHAVEDKRVLPKLRVT